MHLSQKGRLGFAAIVVATMIALVILFGHHDQQTDASGTRTHWLPELAPLLTRADRVRIRTASSVVTLQRTGNHWLIDERAGYPANFAQLQTLLDALATARLLEPKTAQPQHFARLGLDDIEHPGSGAALVEVWAGNSEPVVRVLIGDSDVARGGRFVRRADERQSWLIDTSPRAPADPPDWIDRNLFDIDFARVAAVERRFADHEGFRVTRANASADESLAPQALPPGKALRYISVFDAAARSILTMRPEDVAEASRFDFSDAPLTRIICFDGIVLEARALRTADGNWMTLTAHAGSAIDPSAQEGDSPRASPEETATAIEHRVSGWAYRVSDYVLGEATKTFDDYLQDAVPAAAPASEGHAAEKGESSR